MTRKEELSNVHEAAAALNGKVWPNGLGFDIPGWQFVIHPDGLWTAATCNCSGRHGDGDSPVAAQVAAKAKAKGMVS